MGAVAGWLACKARRALIQIEMAYVFFAWAVRQLRPAKTR
ncbi:hypothetical protein Trad_0954 [Truepera radiovictrix DSM 17093]|uniref:Uncharacterized protein n=1 Tax=Truepera radiovictrix (strain DSM 17093 / CIP 108686 / LMG 22925 / RQ-24) TaxID=649638 RepID=D7CUU5_TRURR|nr:hypothetical protein Trad_0954 [Truepera radiovictrix DSM 17093]